MGQWETLIAFLCPQVVAVDMAVYPPSYGVIIGDNIRETEASRLKTRGSLKTQQLFQLRQPALPFQHPPHVAHLPGIVCVCQLFSGRHTSGFPAIQL